MKLGFNERLYELMKSVDFSDIKERIVFRDDEQSVEMMDEDVVFKDYYGEQYTLSPINAILRSINNEILTSGLSEDQNTVLPRGSELYELYDSILYSDEDD